jgi:glucosylceramidase
MFKLLTYLAVISLALGLTGCGNNTANTKSNQDTQINPDDNEVYITSRDSELRISPSDKLKFEEYEHTSERQPIVFVNEKVTFQTIEGIGGAITDAAAETYYKLPEDKRNEIIGAYFGTGKGIGYNLVRVNIASCDFSSSSYSYVNEGDTSLSSFTIDHDLKYKIPMVKEARAAAGEEVLMFASPWSPPAWMKTNGDVLRGGKLLDEFKQAWANHFVKFIDSYTKTGIPIWAISAQNEPLAVQTWESCVFSAGDEAEFIGKYLGPAVEKSPYGNTKIIAWDHNRDLIHQRASMIMNNPEAAKYVWGFGFHWYETWTGGEMQFNNVRLVNETYPDKKIIFSEGCAERFDSTRIDSWDLGEFYANSMVNDFNCGTVAWFDWNILLDEKGGPNHVGNFCFAPVHADTRTGEIIYTNAYYYIGHFSKFIHRGAKRIGVSSSRDHIKTTGFINPDGEIVVVIFNKSDLKTDLKLCIGTKAADVTSSPHSIITVVI